MWERLDAAVVRRWCEVGLDALRRHQRQIDEMNVYPVPDGDTGANLVMTMASACRALAADSQQAQGSRVQLNPGDADVTPLGRALRCAARGALLGARGNSGVILSQLLRGIADALAATPQAQGRQFSAALADAAEAGYAAVARPVEGTVLTVARAAAAAAAQADSDELPVVASAAADGAAAALARTPDQLPALKRAGVVDAGGYGLVVFLQSLVEVVRGEPQSPPAAPGLSAAPRDPRLLVVDREAGSTEFQYEVQYLLDARDDAVRRLKEVLGGLGDSLVVVGAGGLSSTSNPSGTGNSRRGGDAPAATVNGDAPDPSTNSDTPSRDAPAPADSGDLQTFNVHVHVNDVGAAIEAGIEAGRPHRISVSRFSDQQALTIPQPISGDRASTQPASDTRGYVVVCSGAGLADLFGGERSVVVLDGGPTHNPSTSELLAAIKRADAASVVVLPNDSNVQAVADAAAAEAREAGLTVRVVHTRSPVQALAALAVRDQRRSFDEDVIAMAEAAAACRHGELTVATKEALTLAGRCQAGDVLALLEGDVALIGAELAPSACQLLDRMLSGGGELVTLVIGAQAPGGFTDQLVEHLRARWPFAEAQVYEGGQPHYPLLVGVE